MNDLHEFESIHLKKFVLLLKEFSKIIIHLYSNDCKLIFQRI